MEELFFIALRDAERVMRMQPVGFILLVLGIMIAIAAKRIVLARIQLEEADKKEMELLTSGGVIAVRIAGSIIAFVGLLFLML